VYTPGGVFEEMGKVYVEPEPDGAFDIVLDHEAKRAPSCPLASNLTSWPIASGINFINPA